MLLTITTTHARATDIGHLVRKHPARVQSADLAFGRAHVFYPEASEGICTVAMLLEIDPVGLVRNRRGPAGEGRALEQYVNDRPYVASSFLSVALGDLFGSAMAGRSKERPELVDTPLPLRVVLSVVPCRGGEVVLRRLFEPLGYRVTAVNHSLDETFPDWGQSAYFTVTLQHTLPLRQLLTHLYVLIPVLDNDKHYWVGDDEIDKLLRRGAGWLADHPEREMITTRYLKHRRSLVRDALRQLLGGEEAEEEQGPAIGDREEAMAEERISLNEQRLGAVTAVLKSCGARSVADLGCGEGKLLGVLLKDRQFERILGMDVSHRSLEMAAERLHLDRLPEVQRTRIQLIHGSLMYRDQRLAGFEAVTVMEVIEHLDVARLRAFERVLFEAARPATAILTTPNAEYNVKWESLPAGKFRHKDHRFEWTRAEFESWAGGIGARFGYSVRFVPIGPSDDVVGAPTQMAVFTRAAP